VWGGDRKKCAKPYIPPRVISKKTLKAQQTAKSAQFTSTAQGSRVRQRKDMATKKVDRVTSPTAFLQPQHHNHKPTTYRPINPSCGMGGNGWDVMGEEREHNVQGIPRSRQLGWRHDDLGFGERWGIKPFPDMTGPDGCIRGFSNGRRGVSCRSR